MKNGIVGLQLNALSLEALGRAWPRLNVMDLSLTGASADMLTGLHPFLALKSLNIVINRHAALFVDNDVDAWDFQLLCLPKLESLQVLAFEFPLLAASRDELERRVCERYPRLSSLIIKTNAVYADLDSDDEDGYSDYDGHQGYSDPYCFGYGNAYDSDCDGRYARSDKS